MAWRSGASALMPFRLRSYHPGDERQARYAQALSPNSRTLSVFRLR